MRHFTTEDGTTFEMNESAQSEFQNLACASSIVSGSNKKNGLETAARIVTS